MVIYLRGHGSLRHQGFNTSSYNGCFRKLREECAKRGFVYAAPDCLGETSWMNPTAESHLLQFIELLRTQFGVDKVYPAGASMGGTGALAFASIRPKLLSGVIALCPVADIGRYYQWRRKEGERVAFLADAIQKSYNADPETDKRLFEKRSAVRNYRKKMTMPVVIVHGQADELIPDIFSRELSRKMTDSGLKVLFKSIPGGMHDSPLVQSDWPALLDFIGAVQQYV